MPRGSYVRAAFEFDSPEPGEICLRVGDVVEVIGEVNEGWQTGRNRSQSGPIGNFPKNFVDRLELPTLNKNGQKVFLAMQPFKGEMAEDLTFCRGDLILGLNMVDSSWWKGTIRDRTGIFPLTFVTELIPCSEDDLLEHARQGLEKTESNGCKVSAAYEHIHLEEPKVIAKGKATMDLDAQLDGELSFKKDDIIHITRRVDEVFAFGQVGSERGQFPIAFVDIFEGRVDSPAVDAPGAGRPATKFDWWKDPGVEETILKKSTLTRSGPTPSFEEQTAPIVLEEEYGLNTSHAFYSKPLDSLIGDSLPGDSILGDSLLGDSLPGDSLPGDSLPGDSLPGDSLPQDVLNGILSLPDKDASCHRDSGQDLIFANTLFRFSPESEDDLGFEPGERVVVVRSIDELWLEGEIGGRRGIFPASYVEILDGKDPGNKATAGVDKLDVEENFLSVDLTLMANDASDPNQLSRNNETTGRPVSGVTELKPATLPCRSAIIPVAEVSDKGDGLYFEPDSGQNESDVLAVVEAGVSKADGVGVVELAQEDKRRAETARSCAEATSVGAKVTNGANVLMPLMVVNISEFSFSKEDSSNDGVLRPEPVITGDSQVKSENFLNLRKERDLKNEEWPLIMSSQPSDNVPVMEAPITDVPTTDVPVTYVPVTDIPVTDVPITDVHVTDVPVTDAPVTDVSVTDVPVTDVPVTELPVTDVPVTELPITDVPVTDVPVTDVPVTDIPATDVSSSAEVKPNSISDRKIGKPELKPKPKVKPRSDLAQPKAKPTEVNVDADTIVPKRQPLKKCVSFCLDNVIVSAREDLGSATRRRDSDSDKLAEELKSHFQRSSSHSKIPEETSQISAGGSDATPIPTSPTADCRVGNDAVTIHFRKDPRLPLPKSSKPQPANSKKKMASEKETRSDPDGLKIGQSLFYGSASAAAVVAATTSPLSPNRLPPRPAKLKAAQAHGDGVLPTGVFYTSLLDDAERPKPIPCRPAPPQPSSVPASPANATFPETFEEFEDSDVENLDVIRDIERRISEIEKDLENLQREECALASQLTDSSAADENNSIAEKMEFCRENAVGLTQELSQLKENLCDLRPNRAQLPSKKSSGETFARERAQMAKKHQEEIQKKRRETRTRIIQEVIQTEHDYVQSILLCLETFFNSETVEVKCPPGVDVGPLFGNIYEVVELSQKFINLLETNTLGKIFEEQQVGICFEELKEELKRVYAVYCRNHDDAITLLEKFETMPEIQEYFAILIARMRLHGAVFDIGSILIKPVQRILKYPLLLQELQKVTETDHIDHSHLEAALKAMRDVATYINEFKRRKDLVLKYKNPTDVSLRDILSRLTVHSYRKKIGRISMMVAGTLTVDEEFSHEEMKFNSIEEGISGVLQNISHYLDFLQKSLVAMETVANDTADYYGASRSEHEIDHCCRVFNCLTHTLFPHFKTQVQSDVLPLLNGLMTLLPGPQNLIKKRYHKLLDYENAKLKQKNVRDADQVNLAKAEVLSCRSKYEALNLQLLEDLPKFYQLSVSVITDSLRQFVLIQEGFWSSAQKEISKLLKMKGIGDHSGGGIVETFNIAHTEVVDCLSDLMLVPKSFYPLVDEKRRLRRRQSQDMTTLTSADGPCPDQTATQHDLLGQAFPPDKLYVVAEDFGGTQVMDMKLSRGTVVGIIKESDPMGNRDRFLVTDGVNRGFILKRLLIAFLGSSNDDSLAQRDRDSSLTSPSSAGSSSSSLVSDFPTPVTERVLDFADMCQNEPSDVLNSVGQNSFQTQENEVLDPPACSPNKVLYCAEYPYDAESDYEISLLKGELVKVLQQQDVSGNAAWWLVEKDDMEQGYVPATFLSKATPSQDS